MNVPGGDQEADQRGEDDERHHARLHQREIITDLGDARLPAGRNRTAAQFRTFTDQRHRFHAQLLNGEPIGQVPVDGPAACHLISGSSLYWWNGGGDGNVHSSVVAPAPHGLSAARSLRTNAWATPKKKISAPKPER